MKSGGLRLDASRLFRDEAYFNAQDPADIARTLFEAGLREAGAGTSMFGKGDARRSDAGSGVSMQRMRYASDASQARRSVSPDVILADGITRRHADPKTRAQMCRVAACWTQLAYKAHLSSQGK